MFNGYILFRNIGDILTKVKLGQIYLFEGGFGDRRSCIRQEICLSVFTCSLKELVALVSWLRAGPLFKSLVVVCAKAKNNLPHGIFISFLILLVFVNTLNYHEINIVVFPTNKF